jgi:hypothetical protein
MTTGHEEWLWSWRKGGAMDGDAYRAFGLDDAAGPPIDEEPWVSVRSAIYVLAREIYCMDVDSSKDRILLTGSVTSERVKAAIAALLSGHAKPVHNELEVAAPFEPAGGGVPPPLIVENGMVTRYPSIIPGNGARPGEVFEFTVDLASTPEIGTQGGPVALSGLPAGWTECPSGEDIDRAGRSKGPKVWWPASARRSRTT